MLGPWWDLNFRHLYFRNPICGLRLALCCPSWITRKGFDRTEPRLARTRGEKTTASLAEDGGYSYPELVAMFYVFSPQTLAEFYLIPSQANFDKSEFGQE